MPWSFKGMACNVAVSMLPVRPGVGDGLEGMRKEAVDGKSTVTVTRVVAVVVLGRLTYLEGTMTTGLDWRPEKPLMEPEALTKHPRITGFLKSSPLTSSSRTITKCFTAVNGEGTPKALVPLRIPDSTLRA